MAGCQHGGVDDQRIGRILRALRHRLGWRQADVADKAGVSQDVVSRAELGGIDGVSTPTLRALAKALGAEVVVTIRWRGAELDRLLDEGHATLVGTVVTLLAAAGWEVHTEVSYSIYGERGSIDVLAWHAATRSLLVVEVKTDLVSVEETIRTLDAKVRLAPEIVAERFGWEPRFRSHLLVLPDRSTQRRQVARHGAVLDRAFGIRGRDVRSWLAAPGRSIGGLLFLPPTRGERRMPRALSRKRIRLTAAELLEREAQRESVADAA
jgi:transcriptional regulator with XRE-family HTH domain